MLGLFEPVCAPWHVDGDPGGLLLRRAAARLGPDGALPARRRWSGSRSRSRPASATFFCGPESFTPDLRADRRRGARAAQLLRRRRAQLDRHPDRRRHRPGAGAVDRRRSARRRRHRHSTSTGCTATSATREYRADAHRRVARHGLPDATTRAGRCRPRAARSCSPLHDRLVAQRRLLQATSAAGRAPTGTPRRASSPTVDALSWGRQNWFAYWAAEHRAAREGVIAHGHVVHVEVPGAGARRRAAAGAHLRQPGRRRAGQSSPTPSGSTRPARSRPTSPSPSWTTTGSGWSPRTPRTGTSQTWLRRHVARRARVRHRRDVRRTPRSTSRARGRASCCSR